MDLGLSYKPNEKKQVDSDCILFFNAKWALSLDRDPRPAKGAEQCWADESMREHAPKCVHGDALTEAKWLRVQE